MPNNGWKPSRCRSCKRKASARRVISFRGLCADCSEANVVRSITSMRERRGSDYEKWARGQISAARDLQRELRSNAAS